MHNALQDTVAETRKLVQNPWMRLKKYFVVALGNDVEKIHRRNHCYAYISTENINNVQYINKMMMEIEGGTYKTKF